MLFIYRMDYTTTTFNRSDHVQPESNCDTYANRLFYFFFDGPSSTS